MKYCIRLIKQVVFTKNNLAVDFYPEEWIEMENLNVEQWQAVKRFADSLIECFEQTQKTFTDEKSQKILSNVMNIISIHKNLAEMEFMKYVKEVEKTFDK